MLMKKTALALFLLLLGGSTLSGCTKDEVLDHYNNILQSAGSIALTGNLFLQGTKENVTFYFCPLFYNKQLPLPC